MAPSPQTRDMNPIYTGKDVSYIDTKQANRAAENAVLEAERFAVFAGLLAGRDVPRGRAGQGVGATGLRRAPRRHHRLGVRPGVPRPAHQLARRVGTGHRRARQRARRCCRPPSTAPSSCGTRWRTTGPTSSPCTSTNRSTGTVVDADGDAVPMLIEHDGHSISWLAARRAVAGLAVVPASSTGEPRSGWEPLAGDEIGNEHYRLRVDPARGGGVSSLTVDGPRDRSPTAASATNSPSTTSTRRIPKAGEGPWHLLPKGPGHDVGGRPRHLGAALPQRAG